MARVMTVSKNPQAEPPAPQGRPGTCPTGAVEPHASEFVRDRLPTTTKQAVQRVKHGACFR
jgi:hypothetical protein